MDEARLRTLYDELAATAERPVERTASRWLGEAEAIAEDIAFGGMDPDVRRDRLAKVDHLLGNVESTGDERADEHLDTARELVAELLSEG